MIIAGEQGWPRAVSRECPQPVLLSPGIRASAQGCSPGWTLYPLSSSGSATSQGAGLSCACAPRGPHVSTLALP